MNAFEIFLVALNGAGLLAWIKFQMNLYSDVQVIKNEISNIKKQLDK